MKRCGTCGGRSFVDAIDNHGKPYVGCSRCVLSTLDAVHVERPIFYLAHPLGGDVAGNIRSAQTWLAFLMQKEPNVCFVAPWLACVAAGADDNDPNARERGLLDADAIIPRCDGIVLCGERISSGMARELAGAQQHRLRVFDLTGAKVLPWRDWRGLDAYEVNR